MTEAAPAPRIEGGAIETVALSRGHYCVELINLGAAIRMLEVPDRDGTPANVMLGFQDLEDYRGAPRFYGAVAGRYANRIGGGRFMLDGTEYQLACNDGTNSLHAGPLGFDQQFWRVDQQDAHGVTYSLESPDGFNGFPGTLRAQARYTLEEDGLSIVLTATTDKPTVVNLTSHGYFNLAGEASGADILGHLLQIPASRFTPVDARQIPTGALAPVDGTPFDFRTPHAIAQDIAAQDEQLRIGTGYDHNFVLDDGAHTLRRIATLFDPGSGRVMDVHSTEPGVQFYTGNHLAGGAPGTSGGTYAAHAGLCLEPQRFPDSPNQSSFPSARLDPGEIYRHEIMLRFRVAEGASEAFASA